MSLKLTADGIVLLILIINCLIALAILISGFFVRREIRPMVFLYGGLSFLCPLVVPLFLAASILNEKAHESEDVDMFDISMDKTREKILPHPDVEAEMNYVSVRDAMNLSTLTDFRRLLIDILKYRFHENIGSVADAMNSTDTEASHYAASAIQDILSEYRGTSQRMLEQLRQFPDDVDLNLATLEYIYAGLKFHIMADTEQRSYIYTEEYVAENLFTQNTWFMSAQHYSWMIELLISVNDFQNADKWMERALTCRPDELDTYKSRLRLLYSENRREEFFTLIDHIKSIDLAADNELFDIIRLYNK